MRNVLAGLLAIGIVLAMPAAAFAESGSIGGRPAQPDPSNSRTKSIFVKTIAPGTTVNDVVEVVNNTNVKKTIAVYATDSVVSSGGAFACAQMADGSNNVGKWITLSQSLVEVAAYESAKIPFTIAAPANAEPGEQNGCINIQEQKNTEFQSGVALSFRTAIRVAILIPGDVKKEITPQGLTIVEKSDKLVVSPSVKNTGNVSVDADITTVVRSLFGTVQSTQTSTFPVLRSELTNWNFEMGKPFWGGLYNASFNATYDASTNFIGDTTNKQPKTIDGQTRLIFVTPSLVAFLIEFIIFVGIIVGAYFLYRYLVHKKNVKTWVDYKVKPNDNLETIAAKQAIAWKLLARENSIKAPYILQSDQIIKVPGKAHAKKQPKIKE